MLFRSGQKERAAGALWSLAVNAKHKVLIAQAGAIAPLVTLVQSGTDGQKKQAAGALRNLAANDENQVLIAQAGGSPPSHLATVNCWSVVPPPPRTSVDMLGRRHLGAARAARAWPAFVRAVEVAAVTAVVTPGGLSQTPKLSDTARVSAVTRSTCHVPVTALTRRGV